MNTNQGNRYRFQLYITLFIAVLAYCYEYFLRISPSIMPHQLMQYFSINTTQLGWLASFFYWPYIIMQPFVGGLINKFKLKSCISASILLCAMSCYFFPKWLNLSSALLFRFLMGVGASFSYIAVVTLAREYLQERFFVLFDGCVVSFGMILPFLFNVSAKKIILSHGWITLNNQLAIVGVMISIVSFIFLPKSRMVENNCLQSKSMWRYYYQLMANKNILLIGLIGFLFYISLSLFSGLWGPALLQHLYHIDTLKSITISNAVFLGWIIGSPMQNFWAKWLNFNYKKLYQISATVGFASLLPLLYFGLPTILIYLSLFLFGLACSAQITCFAYSLSLGTNIPNSYVIAFMNTLMVASTIIQPLSGKMMQLFNHDMAHHLSHYSKMSYLSLIILMLVAMCLAIISSYFLDKK